MDIGLNHRRVNADLAALFNAFVFGIVHNALIDRFPGLGLNRLDVFTKHRLFEPFIGNTDAHKASDTI